MRTLFILKPCFCLNNFIQQIPNYVLCHRASLPHFCIINERERRRTDNKRRTLILSFETFHEIIIREIRTRRKSAPRFFLPGLPAVALAKAGRPNVAPPCLHQGYGRQGRRRVVPSSRKPRGLTTAPLLVTPPCPLVVLVRNRPRRAGQGDCDATGAALFRALDADGCLQQDKGARVASWRILLVGIGIAVFPAEPPARNKCPVST